MSDFDPHDDALEARAAPRSEKRLPPVASSPPVKESAPVIVPRATLPKSKRRPSGLFYWMGHVVAGLIGLGIAYAILTQLPFWKNRTVATVPSRVEIRGRSQRAADNRAFGVDSKQAGRERSRQRSPRMGTATDLTEQARQSKTTPKWEQPTIVPQPADPREVVARFPDAIAIPAVGSVSPLDLASLDGLNDVRLELQVVNSPLGQFTSRTVPTSSDMATTVWAIVDSADRTVATISQDRNHVTFGWNPSATETDAEQLTMCAFCFQCEAEHRLVLLREPVVVEPLQIGPRHFVPIPLELPDSVWDQLRYAIALPTALPSEFVPEPDVGENAFGYPTTFRAGDQDDLRVEITIQPVMSNASPVIRLTGEYYLGRTRERPLDRERFKKHLDDVSSTFEEKMQDRNSLVQQIAQLTNQMNLVRRATPTNAAQAAAKVGTLTGLESAIRTNNGRLASLDRTIERFKADLEALTRVNRWIDQLSFEEVLHFRIYLPLEYQDERLELLLATSSPIGTSTASKRFSSPSSSDSVFDEERAIGEKSELQDRSVDQTNVGPIGPRITPPPNEEMAAVSRPESLLVRATWAMGNAEVDLARDCLNEASELSTTEAFTRRVERLGSLVDCVEEFWGAVREGMHQISNRELQVKGETIFVTQVENGIITYKRAGRLGRVRVDSLPPELALAIADRFFDADAPSTEVIRGAFFAITPQFGEQGKQKALQLWAQVADDRAGSDEARIARELMAWLSGTDEPR